MEETSRVQVPVTYCKQCEDKTPVLIETIRLDGDEIPKELKGIEVEVVVCPVCFLILNNGEEDIVVEWYDEEKLSEVVSWEVVDNGQGERTDERGDTEGTGQVSE
jgi:hypothetical protein